MTGGVLEKNVWIICLALSLLACAAETRRPVVFVSIGPQLESVRRIGGGAVDAHAMLPAGLSPETYSPGVRQMAALARADAYVTIGVPFEKMVVAKIHANLHGIQADGGRPSSWRSS